MFVRRQTDFDFKATTCVTLPFHRYQQFAGLLYRYDEEHQFLLKIAYDEKVGKQTLGIIAIIDGNCTYPLNGKEIAIDGDAIWMRLEGPHGATLRRSPVHGRRDLYGSGL